MANCEFMCDPASLVRTSTGVTPRSFLFGDAETFSSAMLRKKTEIFAEIWWKIMFRMYTDNSFACRRVPASPRGVPRQNLKPYPDLHCISQRKE